MIKFRTCNDKLPTERGRWQNININERKCPLCDLNDIGDDFHYLLKYPHFENKRTGLLKSYYYGRPNIIKFKDLLCCTNNPVIIKLSNLMKIIMNTFANES